MKAHHFVLCLVLVHAALIAADMPPAPVEPAPKAAPGSRKAAMEKFRQRTAQMPVPANLTRRTLKVGEVEREFFVHIPEQCQGKASPVVFALHGGAGSSGLEMHHKADFTEVGAREGFVTVYPSGVNGWNAGLQNFAAMRNKGADDLGFFTAMFDTLVAEKVADAKRIYVTGGSNGGLMAQYLVCRLPERIAGAGILVATLPRKRDWPAPSQPVPMMLMLGTKDPRKTWDGDRQSLSAVETVGYWRDTNQCAAESKKWDLPDRDPQDGCRVHAERWEGKAPVLFYTLEGHGHGWPSEKGRAERGTGPKTRDISAPEEFWKFFKSAALPGTTGTSNVRKS